MVIAVICFVISSEKMWKLFLFAALILWNIFIFTNQAFRSNRKGTTYLDISVLVIVWYPGSLFQVLWRNEICGRPWITLSEESIGVVQTWPGKMGRKRAAIFRLASQLRGVHRSSEATRQNHGSGFTRWWTVSVRCHGNSYMTVWRNKQFVVCMSNEIVWYQCTFSCFSLTHGFMTDVKRISGSAIFFESMPYKLNVSRCGFCHLIGWQSD